MPRSWQWLFPNVWVLLFLFLVTGGSYWRHLRAKHALTGIAVIGVFAALAARHRLSSYSEEPGRRWEHVAVQQGAIYSSCPAVLRSGIVYESIGRVHYVLRWFHAGRIDEFPFAGEAFHPTALSPDGPIQFELVAHGSSRIMLFDVSTKELLPGLGDVRNDKTLSRISPDEKWIAFTPRSEGSKQIWLRRATGEPAIPLTGGNCNSFSPAWELDSKAVVFASDCDRGIGLPALYRASLEKVKTPG